MTRSKAHAGKPAFSILNLIALVTCAAMGFATYSAINNRNAVLAELRSQYEPRDHVVLIDSLGQNSFVVLVGEGTYCEVELSETTKSSDQLYGSVTLDQGVHAVSTFYNAAEQEFGFSTDGKAMFLKIPEPVASVNRYEGSGGGGPPEKVDIWQAMSSNYESSWSVFLNIKKKE